MIESGLSLGVQSTSVIGIRLSQRRLSARGKPAFAQ
jgi:hypothetical protein